MKNFIIAAVAALSIWSASAKDAEAQYVYDYGHDFLAIFCDGACGSIATQQALLVALEAHENACFASGQIPGIGCDTVIYLVDGVLPNTAYEWFGQDRWLIDPFEAGDDIFFPWYTFQRPIVEDGIPTDCEPPSPLPGETRCWPQ